MCQAVVCEICKKWTWQGCGQHKEAVLQNIAVENRCTCKLTKQKAKPQVHRKRQSQSQYMAGPSYRPYR